MLECVEAGGDAPEQEKQGTRAAPANRAVGCDETEGGKKRQHPDRPAVLHDIICGGSESPPLPLLFRGDSVPTSRRGEMQEFGLWFKRELPARGTDSGGEIGFLKQAGAGKVSVKTAYGTEDLGADAHVSALEAFKNDAFCAGHVVDRAATERYAADRAPRVWQVAPFDDASADGADARVREAADMGCEEIRSEQDDVIIKEKDDFAEAAAYALISCVGHTGTGEMEIADTRILKRGDKGGDFARCDGFGLVHYEESEILERLFQGLADGVDDVTRPIYSRNDNGQGRCRPWRRANAAA